MSKKNTHLTIDDAVTILKCMFKEDRFEGFWEDKDGYIIKLYPSAKGRGLCENLLFFIGDNDGFSVTNPMERPIILNKPMFKIKKHNFL